MVSIVPTISKAGEQIRGGRLRPLDLVEACLARMERFEPLVHAWVRVDAEGARQEARRLTELAAAGTWLGPLHGIPIGVKDIFDVRGMPTEAGLPLRQGHRAERDAEVVRRLREAGAIVLGKTVTTQLACFDPPPTRNPWKLQHTPGGSSSGSAAAVSLGMCLAALGSQTGGSIIRPASYCGVAGLKPRWGRLSVDGVVPLSPTLDHVGAIARRVDDLAILYAAMAGVEFDWRSVVAPEPPRLVVLEGQFVDRVSDEVNRVFRFALERLRAAGATIESCRLPDSAADVHRMHRRIMAAEAAEQHGELYRRHSDAFAPAVSSLIEEGLRIDRAALEEAMQHRRRFIAEIAQLLPPPAVAVTPSTDTTAPPRLDTTGDPLMQSPWSYAGVPAVTIPCGLADDAMPCGLQLITTGEEWDVLKVAAWCEQQIGFDAVPPLLRTDG